MASEWMDLGNINQFILKHEVNRAQLVSQRVPLDRQQDMTVLTASGCRAWSGVSAQTPHGPWRFEGGRLTSTAIFPVER